MENNLMDNELMPEESVIITEEIIEELPPEDKKVVKIKISRKAIIVAAVVIVVLVLAYFLKGIFIAATVDGSPIGRLTVIQKLEKISGKNLLDSLINQKLVEQEAKDKKIVVTAEEVEAEIKKIETQVSTQGLTLEEALAAQYMKLEDLKKQITFQKQVEKMIADKIKVTDEEVEQYISDNKVTLEAGQEASAKEQIKAGLENQKFNQAGEDLLKALKDKAKIRYFVEY
ncbi:MAG TPA: hypothetical protein PKZ16_02575 [bacterium]|nr:hypothetical protein [bacterium]HPL95756.1 hypothetical protein [bacterium]